MTRLFATAAIIALLSGTALAAEPSPVGDWLVKEGYAHIRIDNCNGKLWGIVAWEKAPGFDNENPDPAKKGRPILGMPILLAMAPTEPNKWEGEIYNSNNGKTYSANVSLLNEDTLKLQGCVLGGIFCGGENWTRVKTPPVNPAPLPPIKGATPPPAKQIAAKKGAPAPPQSDVCLRVADEAAAMDKANAKK
jgi:uncharacterized protein (DUF2147 family)